MLGMANHKVPGINVAFRYAWAPGTCWWMTKISGTKYPRDLCHSERGRSYVVFVCSNSRHWYLVYEVEAWQPAIDAKHDRSKARIRQRCHHILPPDTHCVCCSRTEDTTMDVPTLTVALIAEKPLEDAHDRRWWRWPERPVQSFDSLSTTNLVPPSRSISFYTLSRSLGVAEEGVEWKYQSGFDLLFIFDVYLSKQPSPFSTRDALHGPLLKAIHLCHRSSSSLTAKLYLHSLLASCFLLLLLA